MAEVNQRPFLSLFLTQAEIDCYKERWAKLGVRQKQIAMLLANGMDAPAVAKYLFITPSTVYAHRTIATKKLEVDFYGFNRAVFAAMGVLLPYEIPHVNRHNRHHRPTIKRTIYVDQTTMGETNG